MEYENNLISTVMAASAAVQGVQDDPNLYNTPEFDNWRTLVLNGSLLGAIRLVRNHKLVHSKYSYALTINGGDIPVPQLTGIWDKVTQLKAFKRSTIHYRYECFDKERKKTYAHIHALVESDFYISIKDVRKTTKVMTDMQRLHGSLAVKKWKTYINKDKDHEPTKEFFLTYGMIETGGEIQPQV